MTDIYGRKRFRCNAEHYKMHGEKVTGRDFLYCTLEIVINILRDKDIFFEYHAYSIQDKYMECKKMYEKMGKTRLNPVNKSLIPLL